MDPLLLVLLTPQFASIPLQTGLADSIAEAIFGWLADTAHEIANSLATGLTDELIKGLLKVPNPYESPAADGAWNGMFEISLVLLPIMIALALIAWPFSEDRESGLMDLVVRTVMVLLFIGISQPAWGFAIDATNAVTMAILNLDPSAGTETGYGYGSGLVGAPAEASTWVLKFIVSIVAAILAVLSLLLALFFLLLRWFMIWMAYIGTPFFAVVWFVGRGPFKSVGSVGATFMRMGVFALLGGPIIAIIVLAFQVIEHGGILQATGGASDSAGGAIQNAAGEVGLIFAELALMLLFPVVLIVAIWKLISWAGQPIGVGEAAAVATMAVTAAVGGAVAGVGGGAAAGGSGSAAGGSGGAAAGGAAGGSGASASGAGASAGSAGSANVGAGGSGLSSRMTARAKGAVNTVRQGAHQQATKRIGHYGTSEKLDSAQSALSEVQGEHEAASSQAKFIQNAMANEEMDMAEAKKQGFLDAEPMETQRPKFKTDPDTLDRKMTYMGTDGASRSVNLTQKYRAAKADQQDASDRITTAQNDVATNSARKRRVETGKKGARAGKNAGVFTTKTSAAAMVGGIGGNSYLAYSMGRRAGQPMIGSNGPQQNQNQDPNHRLSDFGKATSGQAQGAKNGDIGSEGSNGGAF
jgi:type IV secretion system protein TrbL